ncbi:MAG: PD40 domain-containing protein, partial [Candidatus Latescibacteria bacterium]|nr:PD40 domain-containing protein [Candidatus Latescibacterota bacterium]
KTILLICILVLIVILMNLGCDWPIFFRRNSNLKLLISKEGYSAFNPVWTPDGNKIYYLMVQQEGYIESYGGQLRVINIDGSNDRLVLDGTFGSLAITQDCSKLSLTCGNIKEGGSLILTDTLGNILDTLSAYPQKVCDVEFNRTGNTAYYFAYNEGFFKVNFETGMADTVLPWDIINGFDVWDDSLIIFGGKLYNLINRNITDYFHLRIYQHAQFLPFSANQIISATRDKAYISNLELEKYEELDVCPYWNSYISFPYWSPDGEKIVFSASKMKGDPNRPTNHELWILEKIE